MQVITIFGSNSGDRYQIISQAIEILACQAGQVTLVSSLYETVPWGFECDTNFLNQIVVFESPLSPRDFLTHCLMTEKQLGRTRTSAGPRYTSRPIDIDILFYGQEILDTPELTLPHPRISERNFVLTPLSEILPDFVHPVFHKTITELLRDCPDTLLAKRLTPPEEKSSAHL